MNDSCWKTWVNFDGLLVTACGTLREGVGICREAQRAEHVAHICDFLFCLENIHNARLHDNRKSNRLGERVDCSWVHRLSQDIDPIDTYVTCKVCACDEILQIISVDRECRQTLDCKVDLESWAKS